MVEGQFSEMDELKRKPFYAHSKKYLALSQVEELQSLGLDPEIYSKVVIAAYRLRDSQKMTDSREIMEAEVLWASAHLAESFSAAWQTTDLERSKSLGAIAFNASERAADVLSNYPDKFFGAQLHKRYREVR